MSAVPAQAELLFFSNGRNMSIKSHRVEGDSVFVALRTGGEMVVERSVIDRITPDEVPYPEPEEERPAAAATPA